MTREKLPARRPSITTRVSWREAEGHPHFHVSVGFSPEDGSVREVFYSDGMRTGTDLLATVQDGCVLISLALQRGETLDKLAHSLSDDSIIAAVVRAARKVEGGTGEHSV